MIFISRLRCSTLLLYFRSKRCLHRVPTSSNSNSAFLYTFYNSISLCHRASFRQKTVMSLSRFIACDGFTRPHVETAEKPDSSADCLVIVANCVASVGTNSDYGNNLKKFAEINQNMESDVSLVRIDTAPFRVVYSPTGPLNRDYDDIRRVSDAAHKGVQKALAAGSKRPHVIVNIPDTFFGKTTSLVACLGALDPFYVPVLTRDFLPDRKQKAERLTLHLNSLPLAAEDIVGLADKLDAARWVTRDIGGTDPERMTAANITGYVQSLFPEGKSPVSVKIVSEHSEFEKNYPLYAAVNRGVADVPKHAGRIVWLEYTGEGPIDQTVYLVGKGVVYDTGGHDIKTDGHMMGMHRDKCGAAAVAGIFKFLHDAKPPGLHVVGAMALVRNEVGPHAYVSDEIITARSGVRVLITNTDAEGRMAMSDVLCEVKERALKRNDPKPPQIFTIATLTGHAFIAHGEGYSAVMENGPARKLGAARKLQAAGDALTDIFELSTLRREDYSVQRCPNEYADALQSAGSGPSSRCPRGHQSPGAFLVIASGLEKHGNDSDRPLAYCHLDIAGGVGDWLHTDPPNPAAVFALLGKFALPRLKQGSLLESQKC